ncbi:uncharacterized protein LOC116300092 isoform X2 [Actinia tenebrosa]|uniref:Uncharacterized protein LOC116300092 isoform X2 n=1 Tax=Actinia tenebrosa TaxID=6105 RepID=A0A6P8I841_ACTTE|nr:uncharacterized protein LOC116300092 isoform X2 [Actinia tenebrosa]XP_031564724.1 uncharacterized protein LOC116300092 isoform X2 [Actinia tenebrosa]
MIYQQPQIAVMGTFIFAKVRGYSILAHWSLNGTEQGLSLHGGPTFVEGRYPGSKAINFNQPSNCFARIPKVELRGKSFTIALWVKVNSSLDRDQVVLGD